MKQWMKRSSMALLAAMLLIAPQLPGKVEAESVAPLEMYFPNDIADHWAFYQMDDFVNADLLQGYADGRGNVSVRPDNSITRAEFVALLVRALGLTGGGAAGKSFDDVGAGLWYEEPISIASSLGIVNGISETRFEPDRTINRGDIAAMIVRAFAATVELDRHVSSPPFSFQDVPDYYATNYIANASSAGIVTGVNELEFRPFANAKRAEAVVMLYRALERQIHFNPGQDMLFSVILDSDKAEYAALKSGVYDRLSHELKPYHTGFYMALTRSYEKEVTELAEAGYAVTIDELSPRSLQLLKSSDRFAAVQSTGGSYKLFITDGALAETTETMSNDGIFLLKKTLDDAWKIYAFYPTE